MSLGLSYEAVLLANWIGAGIDSDINSYKLQIVQSLLVILFQIDLEVAHPRKIANGLMLYFDCHDLHIFSKHQI